MDFEYEKKMLELNESLGFSNGSVFYGDNEDSDDDFDNFGKGKERRQRKKELKKQGLSNKEARQQALEEVGRGKLGKGVLKVYLTPVRGAFLSLLLLNFRGFATKIMAIENGRDAKLKSRLKSKWENVLGGNYDELIKSAKKAENKKPFFCGKQCKLNLIENQKYNNALGSLGVAAIIGAAGTAIGVLGQTINNAIISKSKKREIEAAQEQSERELATLSSIEREKIALAEKQLQQESDPSKAIINDPNLSPEEKKAALDLLKENESEKDSRNVRKILMIGLPILAVLAIGGYFLTRKK